MTGDLMLDLTELGVDHPEAAVRSVVSGAHMRITRLTRQRDAVLAIAQAAVALWNDVRMPRVVPEGVAVQSMMAGAVDPAKLATFLHEVSCAVGDLGVARFELATAVKQVGWTCLACGGQRIKTVDVGPTGPDGPSDSEAVCEDCGSNRICDTPEEVCREMAQRLEETERRRPEWVWRTMMEHLSVSLCTEVKAYRRRVPCFMDNDDKYAGPDKDKALPENRLCAPCLAETLRRRNRECPERRA